MTRDELERELRINHGCNDFRLPDGWVDLVVELHGKLNTIDPRYKVACVKEKFGGLRFYMSFIYGVDDDMPSADERNVMWKLVEEYEQKSFQVCQDCGGKAHLNREHRRYKTACSAHGEK